VLERDDRFASAALVDVTGATKGAATKSVEDVVREQSWNATVTFLRIGRTAWSFYDTDHDGNYDDVLFAKDVSKGKVDAAFHLNRSGDVVTPISDVKGTIFQPERVTKEPKTIEELREVGTRVPHKEARRPHEQ
jgi:hypothetical protein